MVSKVKAAERDRDSLQGAKAVAEAYLGKERECALAHASLYQIFLRDGQVRAARPGSIMPASAKAWALTWPKTLGTRQPDSRGTSKMLTGVQAQHTLTALQPAVSVKKLLLHGNQIVCLLL